MSTLEFIMMMATILGGVALSVWLAIKAYPNLEEIRRSQVTRLNKLLEKPEDSTKNKQATDKADS